jgi:hypothetical protein
MIRIPVNYIKSTLSKVGVLFFMVTLLVPSQALAEGAAEPELGGLLAPIPPTPAACTKIYASLLASLAKPYANSFGVPEQIQAEMDACWQVYGGQYNDFQVAANDYWYRRSKQIQQSFEMQVKLAGWGAAMDAAAFLTTKFASDAANAILGIESPEGEASFFEDSFGDSMKYAADNAAGVFFERFDSQVNHFRAESDSDGTYFGFTTLCNKPSPLDIQMGLGLGPMGALKAPTCTLSKMADNFEAVRDMVSSGDALNIHKATFDPHGNDLSVGVEVHANYVDAILEATNAKKLERQETMGMKPFADKITGKITWPSMMGNESMKNLDPVGMSLKRESDQEARMFEAYWQTGLEGIGILTLSTFLNRLAFGFLNKLFNPELTDGVSEQTVPNSYKILFAGLVNEDASGDTQNFYERQAFAKALGDFIIPTYYTNEDKDLITELSTCSQLRTKWSCSMDQQLATAIHLGTRDGALTIGKAAGIGNENTANLSANQNGLRGNWELIPDSDIVNNTDPSCYQRAYCAGNLKKLRLARILPIGFEMAANSPYNVKRGGKYVSLGEVIRGFYNCNDDGKLDVDHPWCHLIDPNWILAAPRYQCRTKGYGDTLMPEIGTRQEACGDVVSCLGTNNEGECTAGYGYCLAERTTYKFDAPTCQEQFASCRTYQSSKGESLSALRYTVERGACSEESIGCMWYSLARYVVDKDTPDGLWVGTLNDGPRAYLDSGAEPCSSEGCTKVLNVEVGEPAFNLIQNSSFEDTTQTETAGLFETTGLPGWSVGFFGVCPDDPALKELNEESNNGGNGLTLYQSAAVCDQPVEATQDIPLQPNRNYTLSLFVKSKAGDVANNTNIIFETFENGNSTPASIPAAFANCTWDPNSLVLSFDKEQVTEQWTRQVCQFVSPNIQNTSMLIFIEGIGSGITYDDIQLEEGEFVTAFTEDFANLDESYLKIAPDEYACTGNDDEDHPSCGNFARVCRQTEVGCQGYTDVSDPTAPEIPATLTAKDYCPSICSGYGEYRKLASAFDLVSNPTYPDFDDASDDGKAYLIPNTSQVCSLPEVGCEPFTSLEASVGGGEQVAYYNSLRSCQKPNDLSRTYFTWEGSDTEGYVLRTWALIAESSTDNTPKIVLKGAEFGDTKDPSTCTELLWNSGIDQDCRQFYDEAGQVYYVYYSQTVSSDDACTLYRKDDSSEIDCTKTGGHEYVPQSGSCLYYALPRESNVCSASAGGCRAYLGPTGRNSVQTYLQTFIDDGSDTGFTSTANSLISRSEESVLVGDHSLRVDAAPGADIHVQATVPVITTSTLYRVSFWAKTLDASNATVSIDGQNVGSFAPTTLWQRFEFGPFEVQNLNSILSISVPGSSGSFFIDTIKVDQLNDVRFLIRNSWTIPAACDATLEGTPEPRAMLGCNEYYDRDGNQIFARNFSNLCRADSIGCKAFIDTRSVSNPYSETRTINGTEPPSERTDAEAKAYEEQYLGEWSVTSPLWRYYYAIDDARAFCDESQDSCRAFGKPRFTQDRRDLQSTGINVNPTNTELLKTQDVIYEYETVLLKHDWDSYYKDDGSLNLACRKDELHCDRFQSGNVTEYFRAPGDHTCEWREAKNLSANPDIGIYSDGAYGGWFRGGTDLPCYPGDAAEGRTPYLRGGDSFGAFFTGEDPYSGWVSECPIDQSECTEFVDPNDTSDPAQPTGKSYFLINSNKLDTRSCGYQADPLAGCVLFNNKSVGTLEANSKATYSKSINEQGASQDPIDCDNDPENPYCKVCINYVFGDLPTGYIGGTSPGAIMNALVYNQANSVTYAKQLISYEKRQQSEGYACNTNDDCLAVGNSIFADGTTPQNIDFGYAAGTCGRTNDSNLIIKVKLDRECARWMGCRTGETVYDPTQQKFVNQCSELELCEKNGSRNEDIFCAQFTDRNQEDFLQEGRFVDLVSYSSRNVEYGSLDYSGFTIPNQYLIPDIVSRAIGQELMTDPNLQNRYSLDKRLVAELPMSNPFIEEYSDAATGIDAICRDFQLVDCKGYGCNAYYDDIKGYIGNTCTTNADCYVLEHDMQYTAQGNCGLTLCRDTRSGLIGYRDLLKDVCILSISSPSSESLASLGQTSGDLTRNAKAIYNHYIQENISRQNTSLQSAMPAPECQLFPEASSPLSNEYVEVWNTSANPPLPESMISGYEGAKACVFGEDCSCSYRKVRYSNSVEQFYAVDGVAPSVGICVGGDSAGRSCVPGGYIPVDSKNIVLVSSGQNTSLQDVKNCGGGICSPIQDVVILNGQYGYCLERDKTRLGSSNQLNAPCLTWSPQVVLGGKYDVTHYSPTAGYMPPQGSGEYYCTSGANEQKIVRPDITTRYNGSDWASENFLSPGHIQKFEFALPNVWGITGGNNWANKNIDGSSNAVSGSRYDNLLAEDGMIGGHQAKNMMFACRRAALCSGYDVGSEVVDYKDDQDSAEQLDFNMNEGRWITTGNGPVKSYLEYFIPYRKGIAGINDKEFDYQFGLFRFSLKPYSAGAACKWNPAWVGEFFPGVDDEEDFSCQDYLAKIESLSSAVYEQISGGFSGILERSTESILANGQGEPIKLTCIQNKANDPNPGSSCYYKYWEVGYQDNSQQKFTWIDTKLKDASSKFDIVDASEHYFARECSSKNPYFSIRAMFENVNDIENSFPVEEALSSKLAGPWQFVGFWVTSCVPTASPRDPAHLYMELDYVKASVCKEVAQVFSPATRKNAAFVDRVWSQGNFILPSLGIKYSSRNEPFASALAAGIIGHDPMIMGVSVPLSGDYTQAPTFVDSGVSVQSVFNQQNGWSPLSNLFAKIYKIYRWSPYMVKSGDWACLKGTNLYAWCPRGANAYTGVLHCSDYSTCSDEIDPDQINQLWQCNSLSGVNRGLGCGEESESLRNVDPICHNAAVFFDSEDPDSTGAPILSTCKPANPLQRNLLAFTLKTDEYVIPSWISQNPDMKDIQFIATHCSDDTFYASPLNPGVSGRKWNDPLVLLYGLLKLSLKYNESGTPINDICIQGSSGSFMNHIDRLIDSGFYRVALIAELQAAGVDITGMTDETKVKSGLAKFKLGWSALPTNYSLGKWDTGHLTYLVDYRCDADSVNAGHRCLPLTNNQEDRVGKDGNYPNYLNNKQCPRRIDACTTEPDADTNNDGIPDCGKCITANDEYTDLYLVDGNPTGHCQYFNPLSRCTTNADCTFTEFEFWGAYDEPDTQPIGLNIDDLDATLPLVHSDDNLLSINSPDIPRINLPRPLFPEDNYLNAEKMQGNRPYAIPLKYSEPSMVTRFTDTGVCALKTLSANSCNQIKLELAYIGKRYDEEGGVLSILNNLDPTGAVSHINTSISLIGGLLGSLFGGEGDANKKATINGIITQLAESYGECMTTCANGARTVPNGYAAHFPEIVARDTNEKLRSVTIAPFIINTLYREVRSVGFQTTKTESYTEEIKEDEAGSKSVQGYQVISYYIKGYYYNYVWRFMQRHAQIFGDDNPGSSSSEDAEHTYVGNEGLPMQPSFFAIEPDFSGSDEVLLGSFINDYAIELGWNGLEHRLDKLGQATLLNDRIPWKVDEFFFSTMFPLMLEGQHVSELENTELVTQISGNDFNTWILANKIINDIGISKDLALALDRYMGKLQSWYDDDKKSECSLMSIITGECKPTSEELLDKAYKAFQIAYKDDFSKNFADKTGWGTVLDEDFKDLKLYPGAVPVVQPDDGKNIAPLYIPGHCEPPKNGTDQDSIRGKLASINTAREDDRHSAFGRPVPVIGHNHGTGEDPWWSNEDSSFEASFVTAWEDVIAFKSVPYGEFEDGYNFGSNQWGDSPVPRFCDHEPTVREGDAWDIGGIACNAMGYRDPSEHLFIPALIDLGDMQIGEGLKIPGPTGIVSDYRTTCRCDGGKFDGQAKNSVIDCNRGLPPEENPDNYDQNATDESEFCKPVSLDDNITPQQYCQAPTGERGHVDPDLDDNICTHRPGYMPRGDVCADGRDDCLVTYNLTDPLSTNHVEINDGGTTKKTAASATDVSTGLDSYNFITSNYDPYVNGRTHLSNKKFITYYRPRPPRVAAPDPTRQSSSANTLPVSSMDAFSVNGLANGLIYFGGGQGLAQVRFYAWAMHNQGPIKQIIIDWGDGTYQEIDNAQLKNHKPVCNTNRECEFIDGYACTSDADCPPGGGACLERGTCKKKVYQTCNSDDDCGNDDECQTRMFFGNSTEACKQGYFEFSHVYRCDAQDALALTDGDKVCDQTGLCENEPGKTCVSASDCRAGEECIQNSLAEPKGCFNADLFRCRYTPRIMVIDNWGWCTGDCSRENEVKPGDPENFNHSDLIRHPYGGCYDGSQVKINSEVSGLHTGQMDPYYGSTLPNECKPYFDEANYFTRSAFDLYRPWVVYSGSVEVSPPEYVEIEKDSSGNIFFFNQFSIQKKDPNLIKILFSPL